MIDLSRVASGAARADAAWWYAQARDNVRGARKAFAFAAESERFAHDNGHVLDASHLWSYGLVQLLFAEHERTVARLARRGVHPSLWPRMPEELRIKPAEKPKRRRRAPRAAKR